MYLEVKIDLLSCLEYEKTMTIIHVLPHVVTNFSFLFIFHLSPHGYLIFILSYLVTVTVTGHTNPEPIT
jgi:hypothetical protein